MKNVPVYILTTVCSVILACSIVSCGGGDSNPLKGTWLGILYPLGELEMSIDNQGNITEFLLNGSPTSGWISGELDVDGPDVHSVNIQTDEGTGSGYFLIDSQEQHALFLLINEMMGRVEFFGALEKGAEDMPTYGVNDILGSWSGYSYGYSDTAMAPVVESPQSLLATSSLPDNNYTLTMPGGWILMGSFDDFATKAGYYSGFGTGDWNISAAMSADKQFMAVVVEGGEFDQPAVFALNREP